MDNSNFKIKQPNTVKSIIANKSNKLLEFIYYFVF